MPTADAEGKIDFNAVGDATKLNPPAARMRYTRLRRAIESGTLIGTHGTPFQGGAEKSLEVRKKRKGLLHVTRAEEVDTLKPIVSRSGSRIRRMEKIIKDDSADQYDAEHSTDDKKAPLVRRRAQALKRKVDVEEDISELGYHLLHSRERAQDSNQDPQSPSPKAESAGDVDSKVDVTTEDRRPISKVIRRFSIQCKA